MGQVRQMLEGIVRHDTRSALVIWSLYVYPNISKFPKDMYLKYALISSVLVF